CPGDARDRGAVLLSDWQKAELCKRLVYARNVRRLRSTRRVTKQRRVEADADSEIRLGKAGERDEHSAAYQHPRRLRRDRRPDQDGDDRRRSQQTRQTIDGPTLIKEGGCTHEKVSRRFTHMARSVAVAMAVRSGTSMTMR